MGVISSLLGALLFALKDLSSKLLASRIDGTTSTLCSFIFAMPFYFAALPIAWLLGVESFHLGTNFLLYVVIRALTDSAAEWLKMSALALGEISLLASFLYLSPVFVLFLSPFITGDTLTTQGIVGVLVVALAGVFLIWRPGKELPAASKKGILLSVGSAFFFSLNHCFDKLAVQEASPLICGFSMTLLSGVFFLPALLGSGRASLIRGNFKLLGLRGFLEILSMMAKLVALQYLGAAYAVGLMRISLLFSIIGGRWLLDEGDFMARFLAGLFTVLGAVLIITSLV